jgi:Domain of unknown function (DUF1707)
VGRPDLRVGDAERDASARVLREHCAAGRLSLEELDERLSHVYGATTRGELDALIGDLPDLPPPPRERRLFWPGTRGFHEKRRLRSTCDESYELAMREIVPRMALQHFRLVQEIPPRRMVFYDGGSREVTVLFHPAPDGGTYLTAFGHAGRAVRKAFATLRD